jgi:hypothetical protein
MEGECMSGDIDVAGFVFTAADWDDALSDLLATDDYESYQLEYA